MADSANIRVTVLAPSYNHARFVRECVASLLAQNYPHPDRPPLRIVFSDDCSSDGTYDIVREAVAGYRGPHRVEVRRNEQRLNQRHTNRLMEICEGDFFILACGDDVHYPDRVERMVRTHLETRASVVTTNAMIIDEAGRPRRPHVAAADRHALSLEEFIAHGGLVTCFGAGLGWHREIFDVFGPLRDGPRNMDIVAPFRGALLNGNAFIAEPMLGWRHHADNSTLALMREQARDALEKLRVEERWANNMTANWLAILQDFHAFAQKAGRVQELDPLIGRVASRALTFAQRWVDARNALIRAGEGIV